MSENEKSSTNMPVVVVVILAMLGLATFPQGGGKAPEVRPKVEAVAPGDASAAEDPKEDDDLGPLATVKAESGLDPQATTPLAGRPKSSEAVATSSAFEGPLFKAILQAEHGLRFLIVLVPDPDHASMSHEFDLTVSAVLRAIETTGFVAIRWSSMPGFPPSAKDASQPRSGPAESAHQG